MYTGSLYLLIHAISCSEKVDKEKKLYYARMAVLQALISPWKKEVEKKGKKIITTRGIRIWSPIQAVTPPSRA